MAVCCEMYLYLPHKLIMLLSNISRLIVLRVGGHHVYPKSVHLGLDLKGSTLCHYTITTNYFIRGESALRVFGTM